MELQPKMIEISQDKLKFLVLESGDIYKVLYDNLMLNMYPSSYYDGSLYNIYLKVDNKTSKLMGIDSPSKFAHIDNKLVYIGNFEGIDYQVVFNLFADSWFVDVILKGNKKASIYYCFDVGLASEGINEAYNCQYIDHNVIDDNGYIHILSKQNQGRPMMLETSSFDKLDSYSTDCFQFFKKEYKITNYPEALKQEHLDNYNYQYEFAYLVLKSKDTLINQELKYTFYHKVKDNYHIFPSDRTYILVLG